MSFIPSEPMIVSAPMDSICPNDRAGAFRQLEDFLPRVPAYARERNQVRVGHAAVSRLSPAIRHRLLSEEEVVGRVLEVYPFKVAEKFLQEVCWRSYWKGWLEWRPDVWTCYQSEVATLRDEPVGRLAARILAQGSGNAIIDHFLAELEETGYLHNHARMWFAGWWVHQMGLPWQLGAAHFLEHLLDADPASNTLSWRWVAGLQTPGKHYLTRASNLERYLEIEAIPGGRDALSQFEALEPPSTIAPPLPAGVMPQNRMPEARAPDIERPALLWIHSEDLSVETWLPESLRVAGIVLGDGAEVPEERRRWLQGAKMDAAGRAGSRWPCHTGALESTDIAEALITSARSHGTRDVVSAFVPVGALGDQRHRITSRLAEFGIRWHEVHRGWDLRMWPLAKAGFFPFWKSLSETLQHVGSLEGASNRGAS